MNSNRFKVITASIIASCISVAAISCASEVEITREVPVEVTRISEVEITREVPVEVTRINEVEITREVPVEVTREVEITRNIEVTRVVVLTPTPLPTVAPSPTPIPSPTPLPTVIPSATAIPTPSSHSVADLSQCEQIARLGMMWNDINTIWTHMGDRLLTPTPTPNDRMDKDERRLAKQTLDDLAKAFGDSLGRSSFRSTHRQLCGDTP